MNIKARQLKDYFRDTSGATAIEYGLIATLIATAIVAAVASVGENSTGQFESVAESYPTL